MSEPSQKQIEANRQNAKLGGVETAAGKEITKLNAIKHGILSSEALLEGEDARDLERLVKGIQQEFNFKTEFEGLLVDRIVSCAWRMKRAVRAEREMMERDCIIVDEKTGQRRIMPHEAFRNGLGSTSDPDSYAKISRYETMLERSLYKALHELQRIQAARSGEKLPPPQALDVDISKE